MVTLGSRVCKAATQASPELVKFRLWPLFFHTLLPGLFSRATKANPKLEKQNASSHVLGDSLKNSVYVVLWSSMFAFQTQQIFLKHLFVCLFVYREGEGGRKRGRETSMCKRNLDWLPLAHARSRDRTCNPGMCPYQHQTGDPLPCGLLSNQLSHRGQGPSKHF